MDVVVGLPASSKSADKARAAGLKVMTVAAASDWADVIMMLIPDTRQAQGVRGRHQAASHRGQDADVRPRVQHPLQLHRAAGRRGRDDGGAKGAWPSRPRGVQGRRRYAGTAGRAPGRHRPGARHGVGVCPRHRLHARRRDRDHVLGGNRDRPLWRAGRALRRHLRAREGGVRDAGRGGLSARSGLLRVHARAEADRGPDVSRRPELHALLDQRHGRVGRLHSRPAHRHGRDQDGR